MEENASVITRFYTSFQQLDAKGMRSCYSSHPVFNDPVFGLLEGDQVGAMWEMLCKNAREFNLQFSDIQLLDEQYATCRWVATYRFSATGRLVVNRVKAHLRLEGGLITEHTDQFDFWKWSRQALGWKGALLGWSGFLKRKVYRGAIQNLDKYMAAKN